MSSEEQYLPVNQISSKSTKKFLSYPMHNEKDRDIKHAKDQKRKLPYNEVWDDEQSCLSAIV